MEKWKSGLGEMVRVKCSQLREGATRISYGRMGSLFYVILTVSFFGADSCFIQRAARLGAKSWRIVQDNSSTPHQLKYLNHLNHRGGRESRLFGGWEEAKSWVSQETITELAAR